MAWVAVKSSDAKSNARAPVEATPTASDPQPPGAQPRAGKCAAAGTGQGRGPDGAPSVETRPRPSTSDPRGTGSRSSAGDSSDRPGNELPPPRGDACRPLRAEICSLHTRSARGGRSHRPSAGRASVLDEDALGHGVYSTEDPAVLPRAQQIDRLVVVEYLIGGEEPVVGGLGLEDARELFEDG